MENRLHNKCGLESFSTIEAACISETSARRRKPPHCSLPLRSPLVHPSHQFDLSLSWAMLVGDLNLV